MSGEGLNRAFVGNWAAGLGLILGLSLGTGALLFGHIASGVILIVVGIVGLGWILFTGGLARKAEPAREGAE